MSVDLSPRVVLYTSSGALIIGPLDPSSPDTGTVKFPLIGDVPYSVMFGFPATTIVLHFPVYGDVPVPIDPFSGGGAGTVALPVLGIVPYDIVLGPPNIPADQLFETGVLGYVLPLLLVGVLLFLWKG